MWNQEDFFCIVKLLHFKFFSHLKKDQKGIHLICSLTRSPPRGKHSKADAHKVMLHTPSRTDWQQKPSSIWADTASSRHNSTYIASLSEFFCVRCTSAVLIFMKLLLSFSSCIWMCDWNISSRLLLFICRKCRRACWSALQWKESPFHVRFWLGVSAIQLNEG